MLITWAGLQSAVICVLGRAFFWVVTHAEPYFSSTLQPTVTNEIFTGE